MKVVKLTPRRPWRPKTLFDCLHEMQLASGEPRPPRAATLFDVLNGLNGQSAKILIFHPREQSE